MTGDFNTIDRDVIDVTQEDVLEMIELLKQSKVILAKLNGDDILSIRTIHRFCIDVDKFLERVNGS